jgi:hypothetical protein
MSFVGPMTAGIIDAGIAELSKDETQKRIKERVIDPLAEDLKRRYQPYLTGLSVALGVIIVLLIRLQCR